MILIEAFLSTLKSLGVKGVAALAVLVALASYTAIVVLENGAYKSTITKLQADNKVLSGNLAVANSSIAVLELSVDTQNKAVEKLASDTDTRLKKAVTEQAVAVSKSSALSLTAKNVTSYTATNDSCADAEAMLHRAVLANKVSQK